MNGIMNVLKPPGMSSHQVVGFVRRQLGIRRVGHTGTLDPGASGVLPLVVGSATRLSNYIMDHEKTYVAELTLGISTDTQDASGSTTALNTDFSLPPTKVADCLASFQGTIMQTPPMASAIRVEGQRLYELHRQGMSVPRKARQVQVHSINIMGMWSEEEDKIGFGTRLLLRIVCSKGTYVRALCHDVGEELGVGGHMSFLTRLASGPFHSSEAFTLEEIEHLVQLGDYRFLLPMQSALVGWPMVKVHPLTEDRIRHGNFILPEHLLDVPERLTVGDDVVLLSVEGDVLALAEIKMADQLICQPYRVFLR